MTHRFLLFAARITGWVLVGVLAAALVVVLVGVTSAPRQVASPSGSRPGVDPSGSSARLPAGAPNLRPGSVDDPEHAEGRTTQRLVVGAPPPSPAPKEESALPGPAAVSSPSPVLNPKPAGMGTSRSGAGSPEPSAVHRPSAKPLPVTRPKAPAAVRSPSVPSPDASACPSPCAVAVGGTFSFGGLHPIQETWAVGVASGNASHMGAGYSARCTERGGETFCTGYLALPIGKGYRVRISGPGGSVEMTSTDAGPALHLQRPPFNRVADLAVPVFTRVCGVPASFGLCPVDISVLGRAGG